ncbi:MAG: MoaD/ThiS family protein [Deltaproteobacteria bacterium]|nr:MoaD/ThiS family protein [Deltaproteobacteria bacterium]MBW2418295.1 MoaD/ThiS family protein [Deltaproteobacteria bacterium]
MPTVLIPAPYRAPTGNRAEIEVPAGSVLQCLDAVEARYPGFRELVVDQKGSVHRFVKLFINEEQIDSKALDAKLGEGDRLEVLAALAGG